MEAGEYWCAPQLNRRCLEADWVEAALVTAVMGLGSVAGAVAALKEVDLGVVGWAVEAMGWEVEGLAAEEMGQEATGLAGVVRGWVARAVAA